MQALHVSNPVIFSLSGLHTQPSDLSRFPDWHVWKNTSGQTDAQRTHLINCHPEVYYRTVKEKGLKQARSRLGTGNATLSSTNVNDVFSMEGFLDRLIRWIVADDQVI
jgi:hypothetical protein